MTTSFEVFVFARAVLGVVMVAAGVAKYASGLAVFEAAVADYRILPKVVIRPLARTLPPTEIVLGFLLLAGVWVRGAGIVSAALLLAFSAAIATNLARGRRDISCGCFGSREHRIGLPLVLRNVALVLVALYVGGVVRLPGWTHGAARPLADALPATLVAVGAALLWLAVVSLKSVWTATGVGDGRVIGGPHAAPQEGDGI